MVNFVRPYILANKLGVKNQTIYRWIREGKVPKDKFRKVIVKVKRFEIDENFILKASTRKNF